MQAINSILDIAGDYDAVVFDQWGVLHNGSAPYPHAIDTINALQHMRIPLGVLSNSGKPARLAAEQLTTMGFPDYAFDAVMTAGEALALDYTSGALGDFQRFYAITADPRDAMAWAGRMIIRFVKELDRADAVLLMGLPDADTHPLERAVLNRARAAGLTLICSNPDRVSPRADGRLVTAPGALAHAYRDAGGTVIFYGKPHRPVFDALQTQLGTMRILMVGDSPEHDIAGAKAAGWDSLFIRGGIHAGHADLAALFAGVGLPDFTLDTLR